MTVLFFCLCGVTNDCAAREVHQRQRAHAERSSICCGQQCYASQVGWHLLVAIPVPCLGCLSMCVCEAPVAIHDEGHMPRHWPTQAQQQAAQLDEEVFDMLEEVHGSKGPAESTMAGSQPPSVYRPATVHLL